MKVFICPCPTILYCSRFDETILVLVYKWRIAASNILVSNSVRSLSTELRREISLKSVVLIELLTFGIKVVNEFLIVYKLIDPL
jgi:hypothetical protein